MAVAVPDQGLPLARLLHHGLDLPSYFDAADRTLARLVPLEASCWLSLDPATMLPTSHFSREYAFDQLRLLAANEFLEDDENRFADLARTDPPVNSLHRSTGIRISDPHRYQGPSASSGAEYRDRIRTEPSVLATSLRWQMIASTADAV